MQKISKKLIIWDFDGVISDTEHLWIKNWQTLLNKYYELDWDFEKTKEIFAGLSPQTKINYLAKEGIFIDDAFLRELKMLDWETMKKELKAVPGVEDIFKNIKIKQCIATGGNLDKTNRKLELLNFSKYFQEDHIFTAQQVKEGKPEPDLFLLAANKLGEKPEDCVVIEDAIPGLTAAFRAGMTPVAYIGCEMTNTPEFRKRIEDLGVKYIFDDMKELRKWLE